MRGREGAAGKDVGGGEGRGGADAVEEEDLVLGRDEEDAGARPRDGRLLWRALERCVVGCCAHGSCMGGGAREIYAIDPVRCCYELVRLLNATKSTACSKLRN